MNIIKQIQAIHNRYINNLCAKAQVEHSLQQQPNTLIDQVKTFLPA